MIIREEVIELYERRKRLDSVIVRGINAQDNAQFSTRFATVTQHLLNTRVVFSDVKCINRENKIYRLKIQNLDTRKALLEKAKSFKDSEISGVFISKDLTYAQRQDLYRRRRTHETRSAAGRTWEGGSSLSHPPPASDPVSGGTARVEADGELPGVVGGAAVGAPSEAAASARMSAADLVSGRDKPVPDRASDRPFH